MPGKSTLALISDTTAIEAPVNYRLELADPAIVASWKLSGAIPHHPYAGFVRMMTDDERVELRRQLAAGWDNNLPPIVIFNGQILDGRNRSPVAHELFLETNDPRMVPRFMVLVPTGDTDPELAALHYVERHLPVRLLTKAERMQTGYELMRAREQIVESKPYLVGKQRSPGVGSATNPTQTERDRKPAETQAEADQRIRQRVREST